MGLLTNIGSDGMALWGLDLVLRVTVILALAGVAAALLVKASAAIRHVMWTAAVAAVLTLPALTAVLPAWRAVPRSSIPAFFPATDAYVTPAPAPKAAPDSGPTQLDQPPNGNLESFALRAMAASATPEPAPDPTTPAVPPAKPTPPKTDWLAWTAALWLAGAAMMALPLIIAAWALRRLRREALPCENHLGLRILEECRREMGLRRQVTVLEGVEVGPLAFGLWRTTILLPAECRDWPESRWFIVLRHELAHVARWDLHTQLLARIMRAVYWFHPLAWVACRRMAAERERACDDLVMAGGCPADQYARELMAVAKVRHGAARLASVAAVPMARFSLLESRLRAVLDDRRSRRRLTALMLLVAALLTAAVALPVATLRAAAATAVTPARPAGPAATTPLATAPAAAPTAAGFSMYVINPPNARDSDLQDMVNPQNPQETLRVSKTAIFDNSDLLPAGAGYQGTIVIARTATHETVVQRIWVVATPEARQRLHDLDYPKMVLVLQGRPAYLVQVSGFGVNKQGDEVFWLGLQGTPEQAEALAASLKGTALPLTARFRVYVEMKPDDTATPSLELTDADGKKVRVARQPLMDLWAFKSANLVLPLAQPAPDEPIEITLHLGWDGRADEAYGQATIRYEPNGSLAPMKSWEAVGLVEGRPVKLRPFLTSHNEGYLEVDVGKMTLNQARDLVARLRAGIPTEDGILKWAQPSGTGALRPPEPIPSASPPAPRAAPSPDPASVTAQEAAVAVAKLRADDRTEIEAEKALLAQRRADLQARERIMPAAEVEEAKLSIVVEEAKLKIAQSRHDELVLQYQQALAELQAVKSGAAPRAVNSVPSESVGPNTSPAEDGAILALAKFRAEDTSMIQAQQTVIDQLQKTLEKDKELRSIGAVPQAELDQAEHDLAEARTELARMQVTHQENVLRYQLELARVQAKRASTAPKSPSPSSPAPQP
jgi:beta-lactamase regulating signal transducer with metallopeptidase domain